MSTDVDVAARIGTAAPGPQSLAYLERQERWESNARTYPRRLSIAVRRAYGPYLEDVDGNVYIDFLGGAGALPLGHGHPEVVAAVTAQLGEYVHGLDLPTPVRDEFVAAHLSLFDPPMRDRLKVHFCGPTGANAVEAALKLCKAHTGRSTVVSFQGSFHGSSHGAMAASGLVAPKQAVPGGVPDVHFFPYSYCHRCPLSMRPDTCDTNCAGYLRHTLTDDFGGVGRPAAIILELVQGEGGVVVATPEFVRGVATLARTLDVPLIVDEIQTGLGRTGTWWAFQQYDIAPDVVLMSKAIGGIGLPISLMMYDKRLDTWAPGVHIGTFRGHQLAFAASVATLKVMRRDLVLDNVAAMGNLLRESLLELAGRCPVIGEVRGLGLMFGLEIVDPSTGRADPRRAGRIQRAALDRGLIVELGGRGNTVVRLLPPLNIEREVMTAAIDRLSAAVGSSGE